MAGKIVNPLTEDFNQKLKDLESNCVDNKVFDIQLTEIRSSAVDTRELQQ